MNLRELEKYKRIVIQCHNIPDADAIASGFALQSFLRSLGAGADIVYGGPPGITKPNLIMMLDALKINIAHINELPPDTDLLITVDCQRGAGNVQHFDLPDGAPFIVIDHHRPEIPEGDHTVIRPNLASCSTLVWDMLRREQARMDERVQTALYYGLFTDTNGLRELRHPLDRDLADIPNDTGLIKKLKNAAITLEELDIIGAALKERKIIKNIGVFRAAPCDPNLLGFTGDVAQQVANVDCCIIYCEQPHGVKLSVRTSSREIMASEIAGFLCRDTGSGGGALDKAGGFMSNAKIAEMSDSAPPEYLMSRVLIYADNYDHIYTDQNNQDFGAMSLYRKLPRPVGFAPSAEIFPDGTKITIRTLEGDIEAVAGGNIYLMIGIMGEVYPIKKERFEASYAASGQPYRNVSDYHPVIIDRFTGEKRNILPFATACVPRESKLVRAKVLDKDTKVFTDWDTERYFYGSRGDYLVANEDNHNDCYIVRKDIFCNSYEPVH